jgi:hypothetical protein
MASAELDDTDCSANEVSRTCELLQSCVEIEHPVEPDCAFTNGTQLCSGHKKSRPNGLLLKD